MELVSDYICTVVAGEDSGEDSGDEGRKRGREDEEETEETPSPVGELAKIPRPLANEHLR